MENKITLVHIENLAKSFKVGKQQVFAVRNLNLSIYQGETLGLVGESGSGKTTTGKLIIRLMEPTSGKILFDHRNLVELSSSEMKHLRRRMQMIFQDPYASLDPRMTIEEIIGEPLDIHKLAKGLQREKRIEELLHLVGLNASHANRFPHEFSGGQRQRISIARALAVDPEFLICDEPISALDVSIQAQVVNLLKELKDRMHLTYLFIAHDLAMVEYISDRVAVMYQGHLMELAPTQELFHNPLNPYTQHLLSAIPIPDPKLERARIQVTVKNDTSSSTYSGCPFYSRCPHATPLCQSTTPEWKEIKPDHFVACHFLGISTPNPHQRD